MTPAGSARATRPDPKATQVSGRCRWPPWWSRRCADAWRVAHPTGWSSAVLVAVTGSGGAIALRWRSATTGAYRLAASRAGLDGLDLHGPHDLRHTFATWLEDAGIPVRAIDELMGHRAARAGGGEARGSAIGTVYRHLTPEMQARVLAAVDECLGVALKGARGPDAAPGGRH
jgi:integrase